MPSARRMVVPAPFDMAWYVLSKSFRGVPRETEGNYTGQEPATAEGRYGGKMTSAEIDQYIRQVESEKREFEKWLRNQPGYTGAFRDADPYGADSPQPSEYIPVVDKDADASQGK